MMTLPVVDCAQQRSGPQTNPVKQKFRLLRLRRRIAVVIHTILEGPTFGIRVLRVEAVVLREENDVKHHGRKALGGGMERGETTLLAPHLGASRHEGPRVAHGQPPTPPTHEAKLDGVASGDAPVVLVERVPNDLHSGEQAAREV